MEKESNLEDQRPNEEVVLCRRRHPWVLARPAVISIILVLIITLLVYVFRFNPINVIVCAIILAFLLSYVSVSWFSYTSTFFVITSQRVIYIKQNNLFNRKVQEVELSSIYNMSYSMDGFWRTLLNYGNIRLNTQGDSEDSINLEDFENPHFIHEKLSRLHSRAEKDSTKN